MLVVAEMSTGILVACVPTLGPIFFSNRLRANIKARYQLSHLRKNRRTALRSGSTLLTTLGDPASDVFDEQQFTTLDEPEAELQDSLKMGSHYQVHTGHPVVFEKPKRPVDANGIGIRKDFHVFETPKRG